MVLRIEPRLSICKANTLSTVLLIWSQNISFLFLTTSGDAPETYGVPGTEYRLVTVTLHLLYYRFILPTISKTSTLTRDMTR